MHLIYKIVLDLRGIQPFSLGDGIEMHFDFLFCAKNAHSTITEIPRWQQLNENWTNEKKNSFLF